MRLARAAQADLNGNYPAALAAMGEALALDPKNAQILAARGFVHLQMLDIAGATRDIDAAAKLNPADTTVRSTRANLYLAKQQTQDAMDIANDLIRGNPQEAEFFELRAHIHMMQQNREQALADLDQAVRLASDNPEIHLERAELFLSAYDWNRALADADEFMLGTPDSPLGHSVRGFALSGLRRREEALREFDKVIAVQPTAQAYYGRAWSRLPGDMNKVMADLDAALKMDPDFAAAYRLQGQLYFYEANFSPAIKALGNSVRLMPGDVSGARMLAGSYAGDGQSDAAIRALDQIFVDQPADAAVLMDRCRYKALKRGSLDDALGDCDRAAKLDPLSDEVREARAFAYQRFGQTDKAMKAYDDILTRRPNSAIVHFCRAMMELDLHSAERAKADFVAARKADPTIDIRVATYLKAPAGYEVSNPEMRALLATAKDAPTSDGGWSPIDKQHFRWRPVSIVTPNYPTGAQDGQIEGYVDFEFIIEPDGSVGDPRIMTEMPEAYGLADAAVKVFPKWKFTPESVNGAPVPTKARYRFSFKLQ